MNQLAELPINARALLISISVALTLAIGNVQAAEPVAVDNFVRAESNHMIRANMKAFQGRSIRCHVPTRQQLGFSFGGTG